MSIFEQIQPFQMSGSESSRAAGQGRDVRALRAVTAQRPGARACLLSNKPALKSASWTEGKGGAPASRGPASRACKSGLLPAAQSPSQSPPNAPPPYALSPGRPGATSPCIRHEDFQEDHARSADLRAASRGNTPVTPRQGCAAGGWVAARRPQPLNRFRRTGQGSGPPRPRRPIR